MTTSEDKTVYKELCIIKEKEIERLNQLVLQLQETITDLQQYLVPPKFKQGDIVNVMGMPDVLYIVDDFVCYETSYAMYNIHAVNDKNNFETVSEIDLTATTFF
jgi:hypothetical protein